MLQISNLHKTFSRGASDRTVIFSGLNLTVKEGEFAVVVGRNGAGKSTLLNIITGTDGPDAGGLFLDGRDISQVPAHLRSRWIGRVHQDPGRGVSPSLTVLENLALASSRGGVLSLAAGVRRKGINKYIGVLSQMGMGLEEHLNQKAGLLSGGQKQALALTMVVMARPRLLLLDEHTAALDPGAAQRINCLTGEIIAENNLSALMVTHDLGQALDTGTRLIMLDRGQKVLDVRGAAKARLTVADLMAHYKPVAGQAS